LSPFPPKAIVSASWKNATQIGIAGSGKPIPAALITAHLISVKAEMNASGRNTAKDLMTGNIGAKGKAGALVGITGTEWTEAPGAGITIAIGTVKTSGPDLAIAIIITGVPGTATIVMIMTAAPTIAVGS
jgi:hypothetical protein